MPVTVVRNAEKADRAWMRDMLVSRWGETSAVYNGETIDALDCEALVGGRNEGLLTYRFHNGTCQIVTIDARQPYNGMGTAMLEILADICRKRGCGSMTVITTNDNLDALRFYQRRGFKMHALRSGAIERSRRLKTIPPVGAHGIPLSDEIELVRAL